MNNPVWVWGLPLSDLTRAQTVDAVTALVEAGRPSFFITANTHFAMLTKDIPHLRSVNERAAFIVADGAPLVWASRWMGTPLPERVAGSDLIFDLCERAARKGYRLFFLGGAAGVADEAARRLSLRYPGLLVVGTESPPFRDLSDEELAALLARIRAARPDILLIAFGQPKGELWLGRHLEALGVPACVQVGATLDFLAGRMRRAPRWLQRIGLEWAFRMAQEPARLGPRYARNARFILHMILRGLISRVTRRRPAMLAPPPDPAGCQVVEAET